MATTRQDKETLAKPRKRSARQPQSPPAGKTKLTGKRAQAVPHPVVESRSGSVRGANAPPKASRGAQSLVGSKTETCIQLLGRDKGASIQDLMKATGWQQHSVRGFLSGQVRKRMALDLSSDVGASGERRYRIESATRR